jgi:hypothetical protein
MLPSEIRGVTPLPPESTRMSSAKSVQPTILIATVDPEIRETMGDLLCRVVYDEAPGATYFMADITISGDNFPVTRYGVTVQYNGQHP